MFSKSIHTLIRKKKKFALSLRVFGTCSINLDDELKTSSMFDQGGEFCSMRSNGIYYSYIVYLPSQNLNLNFGLLQMMLKSGGLEFFVKALQAKVWLLDLELMASYIMMRG